MATRQQQKRIGTATSPGRSSLTSTTTNKVLIGPDTCDFEACLSLLHAIEDELELCALSLTEDAMKTLEANIHRELQPGNYTTQQQQQQQEEDYHDKDAVRQLVMEEVLQVRQLWQAHWGLLTETVHVLHSALDSYSHATAEQHQEDNVLLLSYYQWRASHQPRNGDHPRWKTSADQELDQRDINEKVGPGHFWGAYGEYIRYA
jgi:hypothetical protein